MVGALLATLLLLELGARWLLPERDYEAWRRASLRYDYDPSYDWRVRPGVYLTEHGPIHVNAYGLRGPEPVLPKPPGLLRVVCLGGSSTFNYDADDDGTWPALLEAWLRRDLGRPVDVVNGGTPGYSTYQSSQRLRAELLSFQPDLVLVYHLWNDLKLFSIEDPQAAIASWEAHGRYNQASTTLAPSPFLDLLSTHSAFVTRLRFAWLGLRKRWLSLDLEGPTRQSLDRRMTAAGLDFYRDNLDRIARDARGAGAAVAFVDQVLLVAPGSPPSHRALIRYDYLGFDHEETLRAVAAARAAAREVAHAEGAAVIDTDAFPRDLALLRDHVHLRDAGLARLVEIIGPPVAGLLEARVAGGDA